MQKFYCFFIPVITFSFIQIFYNSNLHSQELRDDVKNKINYSISSDINSQYLWRGISSSDGYVIQPCVASSYKDVSVYLWGNFEPNIAEGKKFNEIDLSAGYSKVYKKITFEPSLLFYFYPGVEAGTTGEFILKLSRPVYKELNIYTIQSFDIMKYKGSYFGEAGLILEHWFNDATSIYGAIGTGWGSGKFNETYFGYSKTAIDIAYINIAAAHYLSNYFYIKPRLELQIITNKDLKDISGKSSLFNFGITLGTEF